MPMDKANDGSQLEALREAARAGMAALDRGDFKGFADSEALVAYLGDQADRGARADER